MKPVPPSTRIEDEDVSIALDPTDFDRLVKEHVPDDGDEEDRLPYNRIHFHRGELPPSQGKLARFLWWLAALCGGLVFLYGLCSLVADLMGSYFTSMR